VSGEGRPAERAVLLLFFVVTYVPDLALAFVESAETKAGK